MQMNNYQLFHALCRCIIMYTVMWTWRLATLGASQLWKVEGRRFPQNRCSKNYRVVVAADCTPLTMLQVGAGLTDVVLQWISSFLSERTQQVAYTANCPRSSLCRSASHKEASSVRCCTFSTLLNCSPSSHSINCGCICTRMTVKCTLLR